MQLSQAYPGFLELNVANITEIAKIQYEGKSELLLKPLGQMNHGGGAVLTEGSDEYAILEEMVSRAADAKTCGDKPQSDAVGKLDQLDPAETLRKASLDLAGRLPTGEEWQAVKDGGEEALAAQIDSLMRETGFYDRLKEIYAEVLLTGRYNGNGLNLLDGNDYPGRTWFNPGNLPGNMWTDEMRLNSKWSDYGISAEPLELIAYVARNDKPFTEILTADYTVVNYYSAKVYGQDPAALGLRAGDFYTFQPAKVSVPRDGKPSPIPHAGVLTTPVWLNRYPTTGTNLNRARARFTFKYFLATDLLAVAERPIDPSSVTSTNPTRDDAYCTSCHKVIDPVASTYQKFDYAGRFQPKLDWPTAMPQPGFSNQVLDNVQQYPNGLQWLAGRLTGDARFGVSALNNIYRSLIGAVPLSYPSADDPEFAAHQAAWEEQNRIFQSILASFEGSNKNVKALFKGLILSPIYRARNSMDLDPATAEGFGTGRFLTPELLARQLPATLGFRWVRYDRQDVLTTDYNLLYGGIDGNNVIQRLTSPNGIMANIGKRMANDMACQSVAWDFSRKQGDRRLFPLVELSQTPEDDNGFTVPASVDNIKKKVCAV